MTKAPTFTLSDQDGNMVSSADYKGKSLIVYFYSKAMTPGCTTESCDFRDNYRALLDEGFDIVGISRDKPASNAKFKEKENLPFPLLSDEDHSVAEAYGAWGEKKMYGKVSEGSIRSTFVVGPDGGLEKEYRNVRAKGHVARVTADLLGD